MVITYHLVIIEKPCPDCMHSIYSHGEWMFSKGFYPSVTFDHSDADSTEFASIDCRELDCNCKLLYGSKVLQEIGLI